MQKRIPAYRKLEKMQASRIIKRALSLINGEGLICGTLISGGHLDQPADYWEVVEATADKLRASIKMPTVKKGR